MATIDHKYILETVWGFENFREPQQEIIENILRGQDTFVLMPTGGGKSLTYQIPALMQPGVTIVISPLMALIKDQIRKLNHKGVSALYLSSEQNFLNQVDVLDYVRENKTKILYISPERIQNHTFTRVLNSLNVSLLAVDEAHCVSEWGKDFRPSYLHIKEFREQIGNPPIVALTATATPKIEQDILVNLGLKEATVFKKSFARDNIEIHIEKTENKFEKLQYLLQKHPGSSIVYVRTRKEAENIGKQLKNNNFKAEYFHAGLSEHQKNERQTQWMNGQIDTLVATNAFGMGIDKEDVRMIVHYSSPYTLENYYQEIGRAGRDGKKAYAYLFYNDFDLQKMQSELMSGVVSQEEYSNILRSFFSRIHLSEFELPENPIDFDYNAFCRSHQYSSKKVDAVIGFLESSGMMKWKKNQSKSSIQLLMHPYDIDQYKGVDFQLFDYLSRNFSGIYSHPHKISEKQLAFDINIPEEALHSLLVKLESHELIYYEDASKHQIKILLPRDDKYIFQRMWRQLEEFQKQKKNKLRNLFYFIKNEEECHSRLILKYFGEIKADNCGKCSNCSKNAKQKSENTLADEIYGYISKNRVSLQNILMEFSTMNPDKIIDALQYLINENKIKNLDYNTYCKKD